MKTSHIIIAVAIVVIIFIWLKKSNAKTVAATYATPTDPNPVSSIVEPVHSIAAIDPLTITPVSSAATLSNPTLSWTMRENGDPFVDTNLNIQKNNQEVLMQWTSDKGQFDIEQGDSINIKAFGGASTGYPWGVAATNVLIVTDNGQEICNKKTKTDSDPIYFDFIVQGGHSYTVFNYTLADN